MIGVTQNSNLSNYKQFFSAISRLWSVCIRLRTQTQTPGIRFNEQMIHANKRFNQVPSAWTNAQKKRLNCICYLTTSIQLEPMHKRSGWTSSKWFNHALQLKPMHKRSGWTSSTRFNQFYINLNCIKAV